MLFGKKNRTLLGLDITTSSIKLVELSEAGRGYRVESYAAEATPANSINDKAIVDAQAVGEAVRRAVKRSGSKARDVAIAISGDAAITKTPKPQNPKTPKPQASLDYMNIFLIIKMNILLFSLDSVISKAINFRLHIMMLCKLEKKYCYLRK